MFCVTVCLRQDIDQLARWPDKMPSIKICTRSASCIVARRFGLPFIKRTKSSNCACKPVARVSVGSEDEGSNRPPDDTVSMTNSEILRLVLEPFIVISWRSGCAPPTLPMMSRVGLHHFPTARQHGFRTNPLAQDILAVPRLIQAALRYVRSKI